MNAVLPEGVTRTCRHIASGDCAWCMGTCTRNTPVGRYTRRRRYWKRERGRSRTQTRRVTRFADTYVDVDDSALVLDQHRHFALTVDWNW